MHSTSSQLAPSCFPIAHEVDRALSAGRKAGRFSLLADLSVPFFSRLAQASILDLGNFTKRSKVAGGSGDSAIFGFFRLHEVGEKDRTTHDVVRTICGVPNLRRRTRPRPRATVTHLLIELGREVPESALERRVISFRQDEFSFVDGEDMPHCSVLSWSEEHQSLVLASELFYGFAWRPTDAVLIWV